MLCSNIIKQRFRYSLSHFSLSELAGGGNGEQHKLELCSQRSSCTIKFLCGQGALICESNRSRGGGQTGDSKILPHVNELESSPLFGVMGSLHPPLHFCLCLGLVSSQVSIRIVGLFYLNVAIWNCLWFMLKLQPCNHSHLICTL